MNFLFCFRCRNMTSKSRTQGEVAFNNCWLSDERFKLWLKKGQGCNKAVCSLCNNAVIDIATMGVCALTSHAKGPKHQERVRNFNPSASLFFKRNQASVSSASSCLAKQSNASGKVDTMNECCSCFPCKDSLGYESSDFPFFLSLLYQFE